MEWMKYVSNNKSLVIIGLFAILLIISSFYRGKKVTLKKRNIKYKSANTFVKYIDNIPKLKEIRDRLSIDLALLTSKNSKTNTIYANNIISSLILLFMFISIFSFIFFKYILLKILVPIISISLIIFILDKIIDNKRKIVKQDLEEVISVFITQYAKCMNKLTAMQNSMLFIPDSHKYEFNRLIAAMGSSDDYNKELDEYAQRLSDTDDPIIELFVEIIKTDNSENILDALLELPSYIMNSKKTSMQRKNKLHNKKLNLYFIIATNLGAVIVSIILLGDYALNYYFNTFWGQLLIIIASIFAFISLFTVYIADKI